MGSNSSVYIVTVFTAWLRSTHNEYVVYNLTFFLKLNFYECARYTYNR
jgi:hypothetical protein